MIGATHVSEMFFVNAATATKAIRDSDSAYVRHEIHTELNGWLMTLISVCKALKIYTLVN